MRINRYQKEPAFKFFGNENKAEIHASDARIYGPVRWLSGESTCFQPDNLSLMPGIHRWRERPDSSVLSFTNKYTYIKY